LQRLPDVLTGSFRFALKKKLRFINASTAASTFFSVSERQQVGSKLLPQSQIRKTGVVRCAATAPQSISRATRRESNQG
jgi:hypothetical protein